MVAGLRKKTTISLSTWGHRGTAGLVEEWESRIPLPAEKPQPRRYSTVPPPQSTESTSGPEEQKPQ
jgi:hypothetical protein